MVKAPSKSANGMSITNYDPLREKLHQHAPRPAHFHARLTAPDVPAWYVPITPPPEDYSMIAGGTAADPHAVAQRMTRAARLPSPAPSPPPSARPSSARAPVRDRVPARDTATTRPPPRNVRATARRPPAPRPGLPTHRPRPARTARTAASGRRSARCPRHELTAHRRGVQSLTAEPAENPESGLQFADLRHAVHRLPEHAAPGVRDLDRPELPEKSPRYDFECAWHNAAGRPARWFPGSTTAAGRHRRCENDLDVVSVGHRTLEGDGIGQPLAAAPSAPHSARSAT